MSLFEVIFDISVELPNIDAVTLTATNDLRIVSWVEDDAVDWISMADEALEIVWNGFLSFIVPNFDHAILSCSEEIARVTGDIDAVDATSMDIGNFSEEDSLELD